MIDWQNITRDQLDIVGLTPTGGTRADTAQVLVTLSCVPPFEWVEAFRRPTGVTAPGDVAPVIVRDAVTFSVPEDRLEGYVAILDGIIDGANERYREHVVPRLQRQAAEAKERAMSTVDRQAESDQKLDALRERAKDL